MNTSPTNLVETSTYKSKDYNYPKKPKKISVLAFVFPAFIYIAIFYIFKHSPTTLFNNTQFWFFITNTLIFIIAADYGVFSSSNEKQDLYEEYMKYNTQVRNNASSFVIQYPEIAKKNVPREIDSLDDKKAAVVTSKNEIPERVLEIVTSEDVQKNKHENEDAIKKKIIEARKVGRSKSERYTNTRKNVLRRSVTEKDRPKIIEEDEFSTMSNEELNRRVEEFIQKFNRQIRLQRETNFEGIQA